MREKILNKLADWQSRKTFRVLIIFGLLTVIMTIFSSRLQTTMRWSDLLPEDDPKVQEFDHVIREFSSASSIVIILEGKEKRIKQFAEMIVPEIKKMKHEKTGQPLIKRIDYKQEKDFLKKHGLLLTKSSDLENVQDIFTSPNVHEVLKHINNSLEKEYVGKGESISGREKRDRAIRFLNGLKDWLKSLNAYISGDNQGNDDLTESIDELLLGDPYFISYDQTALILNIVPTFSSIELDKVIYTVNKVEKLVKNKAREFGGIQVGLTGTLTLSRDEMEATRKSLNITSLIALFGIFVLLAVAFRMWLAPILALITLIIGVLWATGVAFLTVGILNIMTSMMAVILFGLGIDFSIHILATFTEARNAGFGIEKALKFTYLKSGKGIITGALTTAGAFFCLIISHTRGMKEMGIVTSTGLLAILLVTFILLPILLVFREKRKGRKKESILPKDISFKWLGKVANFWARNRIPGFILFILATTFMGYKGSQLQFDYNYLHMEPKGLESVALWDTLTEKFDLTMDYALIVAKSVEESRAFREAANTLSSVAIVEDISSFLPSREEQQKRIPIIRQIRQKMKASLIQKKLTGKDVRHFLKEMKRLEMNLMEIQDLAYLQGEERVEEKCSELIGNPDDPNSTNWIQLLASSWEENEEKFLKSLNQYQRIFAPYFKQLVLNMCNTNTLTLNDLPESVIMRYTNERKNKFLVTIYPKGNIWKNYRYLKAFSQDVQTVSPRVTGMAPIMDTLYDIVARDGLIAMALTLIIIFILLIIDLRSIRYATMAMLPLISGMIWMAGFMKLTGMMLTVVNIMGLPMILGIGIDDGVHILHRFKAEGENNIMTVFSSTGRAILLTSLTTMLAFGSLVFSIYRGFASLGGAMFLGVGACFLTTILGLSPLLGFVVNQNSKRNVQPR